MSRARNECNVDADNHAPNDQPRRDYGRGAQQAADIKGRIQHQEQNRDARHDCQSHFGCERTAQQDCKPNGIGARPLCVAIDLQQQRDRKHCDRGFDRKVVGHKQNIARGGPKSIRRQKPEQRSEEGIGATRALPQQARERHDIYQLKNADRDYAEVVDARAELSWREPEQTERGVNEFEYEVYALPLRQKQVRRLVKLPKRIEVAISNALLVKRRKADAVQDQPT